MTELKILEKLFTEGKISRRGFIKKASTLGLMTAISPALLASQAKASAPKKGGRFRIGLGGGQINTSLDPTTLVAVEPMFLVNQFYNHLVELDVNGQSTPELAESWEPTKDAKKWVFKLRKGVEFHNGKTLDVQDVIYSINLHRGDDTKSTAKSLCADIEEIRADGKESVVFSLKEGNADFPLFLNALQLCILPAGTTKFGDAIGTGPYKLVEYEPGVRTFAKRNPNYWKRGRAHFDEVETVIINDVAARTSALRTGQIDLMNKPDTKTLHLLAKAPGLNIIEIKGTQHFTMPMRTDTPPYDNNDVRLGLKYAIDRKQIVKQVLQGHGVLANDHPISTAYRYHDYNLEQRVYDPDKAVWHLKKANALDYTFELHAADIAFEGAVDTAFLFHESAKKAGIKVKAIRSSNDGYWGEVWMKKPWSFCWWFGRPTEDWVFALQYAEDAGWNETFWKHDRFNKLLKEGRSELDVDKRRAIYFEMQRIIRDEGGAIIPAFVNYILVSSDKLKFDKVSPHYEFDGFLIHERWWFES